MKKHLMLIGTIGLTGFGLLGLSGLNASADVKTMNVVSEDIEAISHNSCYAPQEMAAKLLADIVADNEKQAVTTLTRAVTMKVSDIEQKNKEEKVDVKELISNLNYDRLGVAKVDNWLNIREKPGTDQKIIGKLPKNAGCHIYNIEKGWAKIKSGSVTGYVSEEYLVTDKEAEEYALKVGTRVATVKTETLNVRFLPATGAAIYTLVPIEEDIDISRERLTKEYIQTFQKENFEGDDKEFIQDVDFEKMYSDLDNWICVEIDSDKVFISKDYVDVSYQLKKAVPIKELTEKSASGNSSSGYTSTRVSMVSFAMRFLGNPYVWGGTSLTGGTDCSGFTRGIYRNYGYSIPRTSASQASASTRISSSQVQPGDLFFYGSGSRVSHVAMYIGNGQVIHASNKREGIKISNAYYRTPIKIGRFIR